METEAALRVLSRMTKDRSFFLNLCFNAPHEPLAPLSHQKELYQSWNSKGGSADTNIHGARRGQDATA